MKRAVKGPTLTDAKGMGGVNAQEGFDYQVWDALARLPAWLRNPAFEGFIVEGLEDVEARFFTPYAPKHRVVDRFQAKSGELSASGVKDVIQAFFAFDRAHPKVARVQTLVTPQLPAALKWISRDADRIKRARPFYSPFAEIINASDEKFLADLTAELGSPLSSFFQQAVDVAPNSVTNLNSARAAFLGALQSEFPTLAASSSKLTGMFDAICQLAAMKRGTFLRRAELLSLIAEHLGSALVPLDMLQLHVRSDRSGFLPDALEIDASRFSGADGEYPPPEIWDSDLLQPLNTTSNWAHSMGFRRVSLRGSYRISTAFTVGHAFRSSSGFELDIETKSGGWSTDRRVVVNAGSTPWQITIPAAISGDRLCVVVGVIRNPATETRQAFDGVPANEMLIISLPQPLQNDMEVQAFVNAVKAAVGTTVGMVHAKAIDLFMAVPAAFAVALGHRWNAFPPTQLYEYLSRHGRYAPIISLS